VDEIWALGARYCVRQDAHAFLLLWALFLVLAGISVELHLRGKRFLSAFLLLLAVCTGALGLGTFYACYSSAPYSMGLGAYGSSARHLTAWMCISGDAFGAALTWVIITVSSSAAVRFMHGAVTSGASAAIRASWYAAALISTVAAIAAGGIFLFGLSWCMSERLF
jgi:hypothetical protein